MFKGFHGEPDAEVGVGVSQVVEEMEAEIAEDLRSGRIPLHKSLVQMQALMGHLFEDNPLEMLRFVTDRSVTLESVSLIGAAMYRLGKRDAELLRLGRMD